MPPPPSQTDPRSPRPLSAQPTPLDTVATSLGSLSSSQQLADISRRLRDARDRRTAARDAAAGFRQRLRTFNGSRTSLNLPLPPLGMVESLQRQRNEEIMEEIRWLEESNRNRLLRERARLNAEQTPVVFNHRPTPMPPSTSRRQRRPSSSQLRLFQPDSDTPDTQREPSGAAYRSATTRGRRVRLQGDRQNSPFALGSELIASSSVPVSDFDSDEPHLQRPHAKRRKTSHTADIFEGYDPVRYGWHGQVDPGHLRLEIVSCDGGQYEQQLKYRAENLLRNDQSVYCSNSSSCSLLLRHQAETSFHLEALVIKGPESGYTHPVQQGLVFVGMSMDELLQSSAAYQMVYSNNACPKRALDERDLSDLMEDHNVYVNSLTRDSNRFWESISGSAQYQSFFGENVECDWPYLNGTLTGNPTTAPSAPYARQVPSLAEYTDAEQPAGDSSLRGPTRTTVHSFGNHTVISTGQRRPNASTSAAFDEDEDDSERGDQWDLDGDERHENQYSHAPGRIQKVVPSMKKESEILTPNATFFIRRYQNRISVRFEPPLAGRYILVKLFNPHDANGNIDVQYVAAYGYSGPRFMPAVQFR